MLRVAAAESPSVKWGGQDISAYEAAPSSPAKALDLSTSQGDMFGTSRQASIRLKKADRLYSKRNWFSAYMIATSKAARCNFEIYSCRAVAGSRQSL